MRVPATSGQWLETRGDGVACCSCGGFSLAPGLPADATGAARLVVPRLYTVAMARRLDPETAAAIMREAGVEPLDAYQNSYTPWRCRCRNCGHEVTPRFDNVRAGHSACAYCAGHAVDPEAAEAVMLAAGLRPLEPYPGAGRPWHCRCDRCAQEIRSRYAAVSKGCRYCAAEMAGQSIRLDSAAAAEMMCAAGLAPLLTLGEARNVLSDGSEFVQCEQYRRQFGRDRPKAFIATGGPV
jgi:hypothetical protein